MKTKITIFSVALMALFLALAPNGIKGKAASKAIIEDEAMSFGQDDLVEDSLSSAKQKNVESADKILDSKNSKMSLEVIEGSNLTSDGLVYFLENVAYESPSQSTRAAKLKLKSILKTTEASEVMRFLPLVKHYGFTSTEKTEFLSSLCRFEDSNANVYEALKVLLNKTPGFKNRKSSLDSLCRRAV